MNKTTVPDFTWEEKLRERLLEFVWRFRKPTFLIVMGGPGAGKGTLSSSLSPVLNLAHISTGNLLRKEIARKTEIGAKVEEVMKSGGFAGDRITLYLLKRVFMGLKMGSRAILDGYPRTDLQAQLLEQMLFDWGLDLPLVVMIEVSEEDLIERLGGRLTCSNTSCGQTYHVTFQPPRTEGTCDSCGSALIRRADDEPESIRNRLKEYTSKTAPLVRFYRDYNRLFVIKSTNKGGKEDVLKQVLELMKQQSEED